MKSEYIESFRKTEEKKLKKEELNLVTETGDLKDCVSFREVSGQSHKPSIQKNVQHFEEEIMIFVEEEKEVKNSNRISASRETGTGGGQIEKRVQMEEIFTDQHSGTEERKKPKGAGLNTMKLIKRFLGN